MAIIRKIKKKVLKTIAEYIPSCKIKILLYRLCGYSIGNDVYIAEHLIIAEKLEDTNNVVIGDRVSIAPCVTLVTSSDPNLSRIYNYVSVKRGKITINNDAWIGTGAIILPNITIGECAVVGAGSIVTKDVLSFTVVAGNPARVLKKLEITK